MRAPRAWIAYAPTVNAELWIGTAASLIGAALGGTISYLANRQQLKEARLQRWEVRESNREQQRRELVQRYLFQLFQLQDAAVSLRLRLENWALQIALHP